MMEHAIEAMVVEALIEIEADEMIEELEEQNIRLVFRSLIGSYKLVLIGWNFWVKDQIEKPPQERATDRNGKKME